MAPACGGITAGRRRDRARRSRLAAIVPLAEPLLHLLDLGGLALDDPLELYNVERKPIAELAGEDLVTVEVASAAEAALRTARDLRERYFAASTIFTAVGLLIG